MGVSVNVTSAMNKIHLQFKNQESQSGKDQDNDIDGATNVLQAARNAIFICPKTANMKFKDHVVDFKDRVVDFKDRVVDRVVDFKDHVVDFKNRVVDMADSVRDKVDVNSDYRPLTKLLTRPNNKN